MRNTLAGGRAAGFAAAAGAAVANTSQATAAGLGLAVLFARFPVAIVVLRVAGAAYLAWLGATSLWRVALRRETPRDAYVASAESAEQRTSFSEGLTVNLLNPVISTFYLVVVPSFLPAGAPRWSYAVLAALHIAIAFTCHGAWAMAFDRMREFFRAPPARRVLEAATGIALLALAVRVLLRA